MRNDSDESTNNPKAAPAGGGDFCCVDGARWRFPDLRIPNEMMEWIGCAATVRPTDLAGERPVLFFGAGSGLEALQFAYFRRRPGGVIAVEPDAETRAVAERNLQLARRENPWFEPDFVHITDGTAADLPVHNDSIDAAAQNCLFSVLPPEDRRRALAEIARVLAPGGLFITSDPIAAEPIPPILRNHRSIRARLVAECLTYEEYIQSLAEAGFDTLLVRAKSPDRLLSPREIHELSKPLLLETVEIVASKGGGPLRVFSGRTAIFTGEGSYTLRDMFTFYSGEAAAVSDGVALELLKQENFIITDSTFHARQRGCC